MDRSNLHENLFSRGTSTPPLQLGQQPPYANLLSQSSSSSPNHLDSLFQNLSVSPSNPQLTSGGNPNLYSNPALATSDMSVNDDAVSSSGSAPINSTADRQSALLSLLGSVSTGGNARGVSGGGPHQPQQVPTPPGSSQRTGNSPPNNGNEAGKYLLEQLMSGNTPQSNYVKAQQNSLAGSAPSPPYIQPPSEPANREGELYHSREVSYQLPDPPRELPQRPQQPPQQQQQPPSPTRKSMFDFVSPFDALGPSAPSPAKKKPVPQPTDVSSGNEDSWTSASISTDPKRRSVENLMDQLTRGQVPHQVQTSSPSYDSYLAGEDFTQNELLQPRAAPPPPLPPKPTRAASPRASPPKVPVQQRQPPPSLPLPSLDSLVGGPAAQGSVPNRKDKTGSPGPRGNPKADGKGKGAGIKGKALTSHSQTIIYDVSQPLDEVQAPRDSVKSTAIALVRQDSVFLPGTTIGATHWVAYAMTKGRVRVISRSSGDRTLLQLPPAFPNATSVTDMAVYGNRLAGVTSDGGFVVWELPELITDDVPGQLLLCVGPGALGEGLHSVKWHPKQSETLAVASDSKIFLLELGVVARTFRGSPLPQAELHRISQVFSVPSRVVAFDFDVLHYALATISEDSTLTLWNIPDKLPFWSHKVRGDDVPSSITFVDDGIVIGRKNGTVFQLLSVVSKNVLATIKFINGQQDDPEMFGHVNYDSRVQTLWVANSRRDSMIAFKIGYDNSTSPSGEVKGAYFEQVVEFGGPKPTIHFVILSAEADPTGQEAHAACVAAKVPPGELALVAFSVHSTGVDQVLIRREWFDSSLDATVAKYPIHPLPNAPQSALVDTKKQPLPLAAAPPYRIRTPPAEELEGDMSRDEGRATDAKGKKNIGGAKQKNVIFKDSDDNSKDKEKKEKNTDAALINESALGQALSREIKKSEESLHTRIGRLIGKEMDKQHHRLEDARAHEQAEDFTRQEKILKLISTELTRNTTRVVEMAVKAEVQNSVLPALENITRIEVRSALNEHVGGGLATYVQQSLPGEIEKLLLRPDVSNHFANILSSNLNPLIERYVKDSVSKTFIPAYSQQSSAMHQELLHELRSEILKVKKDSMAWQNEALRGQESLIRDLEHSVRLLSDQVKFLTMNAPSISGAHLQLQHSNSPGPSAQHHQANMSQPHLRQPPVTQAPSSFSQSHAPFQKSSPASGMHSQWFSSGIAAPQASHPLAPPPPPPPPPAVAQPQRTPPAPAQSEEWDDTYLAVLGTQDPRQLRELLSRSNPEVIMPLNSLGPLSQAVVLTLLHRLAAIVGETPPHEEIFKQSLWWLQRTASTLNTNDPLISPYIDRVVPNVQQMLNTTKSRCAILPGGPALVDAVRTISDIQDTLSRKPV